MGRGETNAKVRRTLQIYLDWELYLMITEAETPVPSQWHSQCCLDGRCGCSCRYLEANSSLPAHEGKRLDSKRRVTWQYNRQVSQPIFVLECAQSNTNVVPNPMNYAPPSQVTSPAPSPSSASTKS